MPFIKDIIIYENKKKNTRVYINQCHNKGKKTNVYAVRRDDETGYSHLLAMIKWNGAWRQYCLYPLEGTVWSRGCIAEIAFCLNMFTTKQNMKRENK